jgi:hypothetical protein
MQRRRELIAGRRRTKDEGANRNKTKELHAQLNCLQHDDSIKPSCNEDILGGKQQHGVHPIPTCATPGGLDAIDGYVL